MSQMTAEELATYDEQTRKLIDDAEQEVTESEEKHETAKIRAKEAKEQLEADESRLRKLIRDRRDCRGKKPAPTLFDPEKKTGEWREKSVEVLAGTLGKSDPTTYDLCLENCSDLDDLLTQVTDEHLPFGLTAAQAKAVADAIQVIIDAEAAAAEPAAPAIPEDLFKQFPIARWVDFGLTTKDVEKLNAGDIKGGGTCPIATIGDLQNFITPNPDAPSFSRTYQDIKGIGEAGVDRISEAETKFWEYWRNGGEIEFAREKGINVPIEQAAPEETAAVG